MRHSANLDPLREQCRRDRDLAALGESLETIGITFSIARYFVSGLIDARRRRDALRIPLDIAADCDWEAAWCKRDEETRHQRHGQVGKHRRLPIVPRDYRDDELAYVDELADVPELAALRVFLEDASAELADETGALVT